MTALARPPALRDLPTLGSLESELDRRSLLLRQSAHQLRNSGRALEAAWTSPRAAAYVARLTGAGSDLEDSAEALEQLRPEVSTARARLESADAVFRHLVAEEAAIDDASDDAGEQRRRVQRRYEELLRDVERVVGSLLNWSRSIDERLARLVSAVDSGLDGLFTGAALTGASMSGPVTRLLTRLLDRVERRLGGPAWMGRLGRAGHRVLDWARIPRAHVGGAPFIGFFRRYRALGRHPFAQLLLHDRVERNRRAMSPQQARRISLIGRWGRGAARPVGWAGTALTVATIPSNYSDARQQHLEDGFEGVEAHVRAAEDLGFRTAGEVGGAVAGAKAGAVAGAALGTLAGPVGTVVGGVVGGVAGGIVGSRVGGWAGDQLKTGARAAREAATDLGRGAVDLASDAVGAVGSSVSAAKDTAGDVVSGAKDLAGGLARRIF